jgi:hypothetical protein
MSGTAFTDAAAAFTEAAVAGRSSAMSTVLWTGVMLAAWSAVSLALALILGGMLRRREDQVSVADTLDAPTGSPAPARRPDGVG